MKVSYHVAQGEQSVRRRRRLAVIGSALALALTLAIGAFTLGLQVGSDGDPSVEPAIPDIPTGAGTDAGLCTVAIESSTWDSHPLYPLMPGEGGVGAELALRQAMIEPNE